MPHHFLRKTACTLLIALALPAMAQTHAAPPAWVAWAMQGDYASSLQTNVVDASPRTDGHPGSTWIPAGSRGAPPKPEEVVRGVLGGVGTVALAAVLMPVCFVTLPFGGCKMH